jgi:FkbM family methyltransferase
MSKEFYALNDLDIKLRKYLLRPEIIKFYVELGANDGISQSNTLHFELFHNFTGILIEPVNKIFKSLRINRGKNNSLFNFACVETGFPNPFIELTYSNLMTKAHLGAPGSQISDIQLALDAESHALSGAKYLQRRDRVRIIKAKTITLNEILLKSGAPTLIGLLCVDVEGAELNVLMGINHDDFRFQYILIETNNFIEINKFLVEKGYVYCDKLSFHDYLFSDSRINNIFS